MKRAYADADSSESGPTKRFRGAVKRYRATPKGRAALSFAQRAAVARMVNSKIARQPELKFYDGSLNTTSTVLGNVGTTMTPIGQGVGDNSRIGEKATIRYLSCRYAVWGDNGVSAPFVNKVRIIVAQWYPTTTSVGVPAIGQVIVNAAAPYSYYQMKTSTQFKILYDRKMITSNDTSNASFENYGEFTIQGKDVKPLHYEDALTTGNNQIVLWAISDNNTVDPVTFNFEWRVRYSDM